MPVNLAVAFSRIVCAKRIAVARTVRFANRQGNGMMVALDSPYEGINLPGPITCKTFKACTSQVNVGSN